jgi:hypothetical protein
MTPSWEMRPKKWPEDGPTWPQAHAEYVKQKGLQTIASQNYGKFFSAAAKALKPRAIEATWLKILTMQQEGALELSKDFIVATAGASIEYIKLRKDMFPCVTPHMTYIVCDRGQLRLGTGFDAMAVQGLQSEELAAHKLSPENPALLQDLAGNAFTSTILAAYVLATLLVK